MALSTLRYAAMRTSLLAHHGLYARQCVPMATTAHEQMKAFWKKNQELGRPVAPWIVYKPHLPMLTSLCHRVTGICMGVALYGIGIGTFMWPGDFQSMVVAIKALNIPTFLLFDIKMVCAFPLIYHYTNGIRHLYWDYKGGYELATQYKTGWSIVTAVLAMTALAASCAYW